MMFTREFYQCYVDDICTLMPRDWNLTLGRQPYLRETYVYAFHLRGPNLFFAEGFLGFGESKINFQGRLFMIFNLRGQPSEIKEFVKLLSRTGDVIVVSKNSVAETRLREYNILEDFPQESAFDEYVCFGKANKQRMREALNWMTFQRP